MKLVLGIVIWGILSGCFAWVSQIRHGRSRSRLTRQMKRSDDYWEWSTEPSQVTSGSSMSVVETSQETTQHTPAERNRQHNVVNDNAEGDIVTRFLRIVESQQQLGENCTAGTDLNLGEGVVDRYAQERFRVEAEVAVNRANMLSRLWKYASPDVLNSEYLLHAGVFSMVEFDEDIFAAGNCYDQHQYKHFWLFCPYAYRLPEGPILVKDLAVEYKYLSNTSEWFYIARKNAEKVIKNYNQFSRVEIRSKGGPSFNIISAYFDCTRNINNDTQKITIALETIKYSYIILGIDSNSRSASWYDTITNQRGKILENYLAEKSLYLENLDDGKPTFETKRGRSWIDLVVTTSQMIQYVQDWVNNDEESASDHRYLTYIVRMNGQKTNSSETSRKYIVKKANWNKFNQILVEEISRIFSIFNKDLKNRDKDYRQNTILDDELHKIIKKTTNLDTFCEKFTKAITNTCNKSIPRYKTQCKKEKPSGPWWNQNLTDIRNEVIRLRKVYQKTKDTKLREVRKDEYWNTKKMYIKEINTSKINSWKNFCNTEGSEHPWGPVYKTAAGKLHPPTILSTLKKEDGSFTCTLKETLSEILHKCIPDDLGPKTEHHREMIDSMDKDINTDNDIPFTQREVKHILNNFQENEAPGNDGFTKTILKQIESLIPRSFSSIFAQCLKHAIFPKIWKRSQLILLNKPGKESIQDASKYRPICLLPIMGKILEKLMANRIMHTLRQNLSMSPKQFGFGFGNKRVL